MRRKEDFPLQKVTLNLFDGEFARLQDLYPRIGAAKIIRDLVHSHLRKVEESAIAKRPRQLDFDLKALAEDIQEL